MSHDHKQAQSHANADEDKKPLTLGALSKLDAKHKSELLSLAAAMKTVHTAFRAMETVPKVKITITPDGYSFDCLGAEEACRGLAEAFMTIYGCGCYSRREGGVGCDCPD
jgi:hypothetical protein